MNENIGTTKLLILSRSKLGESHLDFQSDAVAVRFGAKSSSIALVESSDDDKVLIFQVTYTEALHRSMCVDFLASGDKNDQIKRIFVNQLVPEFTEGLAQFADRTKLINFEPQVSKSAKLLLHLADSFENILYVDAEDCAGLGQAAGAGTRAPAAGHVALISSSSECGSQIRQGFGSDEFAVKPLEHAVHRTLVDTHQSILSFLTSDAQMAIQGDSTEGTLTHLLHNFRMSDKSDIFQTSFAAVVQPALAAYAAIISENYPANQDFETDVFISDCIFNSQFCRRIFLGKFLRLSDTKCKTIRFVKDPGVLGFLGALLSC